MAVKGSPICFVCLAGVESSDDNVNGSECDLYLRFIQVAQNYLKIPLTSLNPLLSISKTNDGDKMFCESCVKVVRQICNSYLELVQAQLRLSWKLGELEKLLENSLNSDRTRKLANNLRIPDVAEVEEIRELLSVRCEHMSQRFQPQLVITRNEAISASFNNTANLQPGVDASHSQSDQFIKKEVECSSENCNDNDWNPSGEDGNASDADETSPFSSKTYNIILMDSQIKMEDDDDDKNSDSKDGPDCSSEEDDEGSSPAFGARKMRQFQSKTISKSESGEEGFERQCCFCWKSFQTPQLLARHVSSSHSNPLLESTRNGTFPCEEEGCHQKFESQLELNSHLKEHTLELSFCRVCGWGFINSNLLRLHELVHIKPLKGKRGVLCPKSNCDSRFETIAMLQGHYNSKHGASLKRFSCSECEHVATSLQALGKHKRIHHLRKPEKGRPLPKKLQTAPKVSCEVGGCPEQFKNHFKLNSHLKTHSELISFCKRCGYGFIDKNLLELHKLTHLMLVKVDGLKYGSYYCPETGCSFRNPKISRLQDHYNVRHGVALKCFKCGQCDYVGATLAALQFHKRSKHNGIKRIQQKEEPKKCVHCQLVLPDALETQ